MLMQKAREGFALIVVVIGVLVLSTLTVTALGMGTQESRSARATRVSASALYTADTGVTIERAGDNWPDLDPGEADTLAWRSLPNLSRYRPIFQRRDAALGNVQIFSLTVEGASPAPLGGEATVQIWATRFKLSAKFQAGITARGNAVLNGSTTHVDSYDSELYPPALNSVYCDSTLNANTGCALNVGSEGDVHANGWISLTGNGAEIDGNASAGDTIRDPHDGISGTELEHADEQYFAVETCRDYTESMPGLSYSKPDVSINSDYTIAGGTYTFRNFKMRNATLIIPDGEVVTIYLSGWLDLGGGNSVNNVGHKASALSFIACDGATRNETTWTLHGGSDAYFTVYAPYNDVELRGDSPVFGAIVADNFKANGGSQVHYDVALGRLPDEDGDSLSAIMPRSWRQLLR